MVDIACVVVVGVLLGHTFVDFEVYDYFAFTDWVYLDHCHYLAVSPLYKTNVGNFLLPFCMLYSAVTFWFSCHFHLPFPLPSQHWIVQTFP